TMAAAIVNNPAHFPGNIHRAEKGPDDPIRTTGRLAALSWGGPFTIRWDRLFRFPIPNLGASNLIRALCDWSITIYTFSNPARAAAGLRSDGHQLFTPPSAALCLPLPCRT